MAALIFFHHSFFLTISVFLLNALAPSVMFAIENICNNYKTIFAQPLFSYQFAALACPTFRPAQSSPECSCPRPP
jgi:hypothetical protein